MRIIIERERKFKKQLGLIWVALNLCRPKGEIEIYDVMKAIEQVVGNRKIMREWNQYLKDKKTGKDWIRKYLDC